MKNPETDIKEASKSPEEWPRELKIIVCVTLCSTSVKRQIPSLKRPACLQTCNSKSQDTSTSRHEPCEQATFYYCVPFLSARSSALYIDCLEYDTLLWRVKESDVASEEQNERATKTAAIYKKSGITSSTA